MCRLLFTFSIMSDGSGDGFANNASTTPPQQSNRDNAFERLFQHFMAHKVDSAMWFLRVMTLFFIFNYFIPIFG